MRRLDDALTLVEDILAWAAVAILVAITTIVSADVMMRYLFDQPFSWAYDFISFYLMAALFYLAVSRAFSLNAHIGVDILQRRLPKTVRLCCQMIVGVLSLMLFITIGKVNFSSSLDDFLSGSATVGEIAWPTWISTAIVVLGCTALSLRMAFYALQNMLALFGNPVALRQLDSLARVHGEGAHAE
jgi:TRAP-type C4-dicarboxylate transport system permease small subunit